MYKRYYFIKRLYPKTIIIIKQKEKYISFDIDKDILTFIDDYSVLDKYHINYMIIDNLDIIKFQKYQNNDYDKYMYISKLVKLLFN